MRRRRGLVIAAVVLVVLLAAGGAAAWYVFADDSPPPPKLQDTEADADAGTTPDGTWTVGSGGYVGYRVEEKFGGETITKTAVGRTPKVSGTMVVRGNTVESADVTADVTALESDREPRDTYLHDNALETNRYGTARFRLTAPAALPAAPQPGKVLKVPVTGDLELHGTTRSVRATLDGRWDGNRIEVAGVLPIRFADYGIATPDSAIVTTEDHGELELALIFRRT